MTIGDTVFTATVPYWWCNIEKKGLPGSPRVVRHLVVAVCDNGDLLLHAETRMQRHPRRDVYATEADAVANAKHLR
jgi:hypothetical protein